MVDMAMFNLQWYSKNRLPLKSRQIQVSLPISDRNEAARRAIADIFSK